MTRTRLTFFGSILAGALLTAGTAQADSLTINDASFENSTGHLKNGLLGIGAEHSKDIGGWHFERSSLLGLLPPDTGIYESHHATDGEHVASICTSAGVAGHVTIEQILEGQSYQANTRYTLQVDVNDGELAQVLNCGPTIALTADGKTIASSGESTLLSLFDCGNGFETWTLTFVTGTVAPKGDIGIALSSMSLANVMGTVSFDNVRLNAAAVPTPTAIGAGLACMTLMILRRRRTGAPAPLSGTQA